MTDKLKMPVSEELREYFRKLGRIRGNQLKEKYGSEYFKKIAAMRKTYGRQGKPSEPGSIKLLANLYKVSRQRIHQILKTFGNNVDRSEFKDENSWRKEVIKKYFESKV